MNRRIFTSEAVTEGHPDKICDQISDAILDDILANDPNGRVACETICTTGMVMVFGEITTNHYVDVQKIVRETVTEIGYVRGKYGFDADNLAVLTAIDPQSPDIAMGVDESDDHAQGAGAYLWRCCHSRLDCSGADGRRQGCRRISSAVCAAA